MRKSVAKRLRKLAPYIVGSLRDLKRAWYSAPRNKRRVLHIDLAIAHGKHLESEAKAKAVKVNVE